MMLGTWVKSRHGLCKDHIPALLGLMLLGQKQMPTMQEPACVAMPMLGQMDQRFSMCGACFVIGSPGTCLPALPS